MTKKRIYTIIILGRVFFTNNCCGKVYRRALLVYTNEV